MICNVLNGIVILFRFRGVKREQWRDWGWGKWLVSLFQPNMPTPFLYRILNRTVLLHNLAKSHFFCFGTLSNYVAIPSLFKHVCIQKCTPCSFQPSLTVIRLLSDVHALPDALGARWAQEEKEGRRSRQLGWVPQGAREPGGAERRRHRSAQRCYW